MIAKIIKGSDFKGLLDYLTKKDRGDIFDRRNLSAIGAADIAQEMGLAASLSSRTKKPVMHISLSYGPGETPSRAEMQADAGAALKALNLDTHQAVAIQHRDRDHTHFHIAVNRVGADGKAAHDGKSYARLEAALRRIEIERGWSVVHGRNAPSAEGPRFTGFTKPKDPRQFTVPPAVKQVLLSARSEIEMTQKLGNLGWTHEITRRPGNLPGLLLVGPDGQRIAASKIDRGASYSALQRRWGGHRARHPTSPKRGDGVVIWRGKPSTRSPMASLNRPI